jgi:hypothetical protein
MTISGNEQGKAAHTVAEMMGTPIEQVPDIPEGEPLCQEWQTFKREVHRLVKEGKAGRYAVVKGDEVVGVWDTLTDAVCAGHDRFRGEPCLVQEIQLYVRPLRWGYYKPCPA